MALNRDEPASTSLAGGPLFVADDSEELGKKETRGFLNKWIPRPSNASKLVAAQLHDELIDAKRDRVREVSNSDERILPCPFIRPLKNKLEPRVESAPLARRPLTGSNKQLARKEVGLLHAARNYRSPSETDGEARPGVGASDAISLRNLRLREDIAAAAAADSSHLKEWGYYIKCYSEGCFNLILPPGPPPMKSTFTYLPSTYPPNEAKRLALFQSSEIWSGIDIIWTPQQAERARGLIKAVTAEFSAPWSAVSFFDLDSEIVQAERGYSRHLIPRRQSIASHVLLTNEVMTILDAQKDWRFAGNPLIREHPKIRFFAGAPLLSSNGEVVGVFSIFSPEPRACFTATQRRELTRFSEMAIQELTSPTKANSEKSVRSIPILQPSSISNSASKTRNLCATSTDLNGLHISDPSPPTLWYHKPSQYLKTKSRIFINVQKQEAPPVPTGNKPPYSDDSDCEPFSLSVQGNKYKRDLKELTLNTKSNQARDSLETPDSPTFGYYLPSFRCLQPKAFPGSSLMSIDHEPHLRSPDSQHMNTPSLSSDYSVNLLDAFSFDDTELLLPPSQRLSNVETSSTKEELPAVNKIVSPGGISEHFNQRFGARAACFVPSENGESVDENSRRSPGRVWGDRARNDSCMTGEALWEGRKQFDPYAEAKSATEYWAKHLGFDIIYAVELIPRKLFMTDSELQDPGGMETRILASYGLHNDIDFDIAMHLGVLNGSGGMIWENKEGRPEEFRRGFMMPLPFDFGVLEYRSKGVVFGAFRKKAIDSATLPELDSADIRRLRKAARGLKKILHRVPTLRQPNYSMAEPQTTPTRKTNSVYGAAEMVKRLSNVESELFD